MKYTPENQQVHLYIDSVKEMVAYSPANDPSYDFFLKEYFKDSRVALLKGVNDGIHDLADEKIAWKAYGNMEEESKKAFAAKTGDITDTPSSSSAFDTREFLRSLPGCVVDELAAALEKLQAT
jgi:hypothetical protein